LFIGFGQGEPTPTMVPWPFWVRPLSGSYGGWWDMVRRTMVKPWDDNKNHNKWQGWWRYWQKSKSIILQFQQCLEFIKLYKCQYFYVAPHTIATRKCWLYFYFFENWKALNNQNRETNYATLMKRSQALVGTIIVQQTSH